MGTPSSAVQGSPSRRLLAAALSLLFIQVTAPLPSEAATKTDSPAPPVLGASNVIRGSSTRAMPVRLDQDAAISLKFLNGNPDIQVRGSGRLTGFVLTRADIGNPERPTLAAIRTSLCTKRKCESAFNVTLYEGGGIAQTDKGSLPAGDYLLYLIADGKPVRVELKLPGLEGSTHLGPSQDVASEIYEPDPSLSVEQAKNVYSDGRIIEAEGGSMWAFGAYRIRGNAFMGGKFSICVYRGDPPPSPVGFAPGCPGGFEVSAVVTRLVPSGPYDVIHHGGAFMSDGGTWGYGRNYVTSGVVENLDAVAIYIDFKPLD